MRLKRGFPVSYLIGFVPFLNIKVDLSKKPFIPRPETEYWTEIAIGEMKKDKKRIKCLDLFAGSGCIGIAILKEISKAEVIFGEIDSRALKQIKINLLLNKIPLKRASLVKTNVFQNIKGKYDYILANPPYIAQTQKSLVQRSVLSYEPHRALFGGKDGLDYIKQFLKQARFYLKKQGKIYLEFDPSQKNKIQKIIQQQQYSSHNFFKDQYERWRFVVIQR